MSVYISHCRALPWAAALILFLSGSAFAQTAPGGFTVTPYGDRMEGGTSMAWAPDGRLFVCQSYGNLMVIKNGVLLPTPFLSVRIRGEGEQGLIGVTVDPDYATNHAVYVFYCAAGLQEDHVSRFVASPSNPDVADPSVPEQVILRIPTTSWFHHGGSMHFGPVDRKLYVSVGDMLTRGATSQDATVLNGKILRINPDGSIPADNPTSFDGIATPLGGPSAAWCLGLRNPFTFAFQPGSQRMLINDVGEDDWEEIDDGIAGKNYGWQGGATDGPRSLPPFTDPLFAYRHQNGTPRGPCIAGGTFYNPSVVQFPSAYVGKYFFADNGAGWIYTLDPAAPGSASPFFVSGATPIQPCSVQVGPDGALYVLARAGTAGNNPGVYRIAYTGSASQALVVSANEVSLNEGATTTFTVHLAATPAAATVVDVANIIGTSTVTVSPARLTFQPGDFFVDQTVTVSAAPDSDTVDNGATLELACPAAPSQYVVVTVTDTNARPTARIALPQNGQTVSGQTAEFYGHGTVAAPATLTRAEFSVDGALIYTDPYDPAVGHFHVGGAHARWDTTRLSNGPHVLRMTVYDDSSPPLSGSHEVTVTVDNTSAVANQAAATQDRVGSRKCGTTGLEALVLMGILRILRRPRRMATQGAP